MLLDYVNIQAIGQRFLLDFGEFHLHCAGYRTDN